MQYSSLRRVSILHGPPSQLSRTRRFSLQTPSAPSVSLSRRSAFRVPSYSARELQAMSATDLKTMMKDNGLRFAGGKTTLVDRAMRYVHQHPIPTSSSRLQPQLSSKGQRLGSVRGRLAAAPAIRSLRPSSKGWSSAQKSSSQMMNQSRQQEIFGHDHDFGTQLATRAHFEGSSLSWAAPAPAPPLPQANFFSSTPKHPLLLSLLLPLRILRTPRFGTRPTLVMMPLTRASPSGPNTVSLTRTITHLSRSCIKNRQTTPATT